MRTTLYDTGGRMKGTISTGASAAPSTDDFAPPTPDEQRVSTRLYDRNSAATPTPTGPDALYGLSTLSRTLDSRLPELWTATGASEATQKQTREMFLGIARRTGLPEPLVATIAEHTIDHQLADARPADDATATDEARATQIADWNTETRTALQATYGGAKEADALLARAQRFVKAHPALDRVLSQGGLGSRPDVVQEIVAHVFSNGIR